MRSRMYSFLGLTLIYLVLLTGCTTKQDDSYIPLAKDTTLSCTPPSKPVSLTWHDGGYWVRGTATNNAQLRAILMPTTNLPLQAGTDVKIVWQMSGSGNFTIVAQGPDGASVLPTQGPGPHGAPNPSASSWNGWGEWGTVFRLPMAGCWTFHATRDNASGDLSLLVVAA